MDTVLLTNGRFWGTQAREVLVKGGRIVRVGEGVTPVGTKVVDLGGRVVLPGVVDAHVHVFWLGEQLYRQVDLRGSTSVGEVCERMAAWARAHGEGWVIGRGVNDALLAEGRLPTGEEIGRAVGGRPAAVNRVCGHVGVVSPGAAALLPAEVRREVDAGGKLEEGAWWEALGAVPEMTWEECEGAALMALEHARARGFTGVVTMLEEERQVRVLEKLWREGRLPIRVTANVPGAAAEEIAARGLRSGQGDDWFRVGAAKFFADGTLGARTAWLADDYADEPGERGKMLISPGEMREKFARAAGLGFQVAVHAIGDEALRQCVAALEPLCGSGANANPLRHRIEHVSLCDEDSLGRIARARIWSVVQPQFVGADTWMRERVGERARWAYRFGAMERAGVRVALSSDTPVEEMNVGETLAWATGGHAWNEEGAMSREAAVVAYTSGAREVGWMEPGGLVAGALGDFSVVEGDPFDAAAKVEAWVGGVLGR